MRFDPSCIRCDDRIGVWILHSLRPGTLQPRVRTWIAPVPRSHPAYRFVRDTDADGIVCD